ncbi:MAG: ribosomal L7Ae/L30e/S12e/Gadd45 family protein [Clostridia bacterium]|nr:ribosomal L7Ae/L30e/S12e/Gadd45 family protein [Clostridia bacterium]
MAACNKRYLGTLGIAAAAGKTVAGTPRVCEALKNGKAFLVVEAEGNSEGTRKRLSDRCAFYQIRLIESDAGKDELGRAVGRPEGVAVVAVCDRGLAGAVAEGWDRPEKSRGPKGGKTGAREI